MNFSTQALSALEVLRSFGTDVPVLQALSDVIPRAHKYLVPPPRAVRTKVTEQSAPFIRPTFPECIFEYEVPDSRAESTMLAGSPHKTGASSRRLALVLDLGRSTSALAAWCKRAINGVEPEPAEIAIIVLYYLDDPKMWTVAPGFATWARSWVSTMLIDGTQQAMTYGVCPLTPDTMQEIIVNHRLPADEASTLAWMRNDVHEDVAVVLRMLALINARNLREVAVTEAPVKLNKKRATKGNPPFFSYHTLDVFLSGSRSHNRKFMPSMADIQKLWGSSLPQQEVSGHFNHRGSLLWWVDSYHRGSAANGVRNSDHRVRNT